MKKVVYRETASLENRTRLDKRIQNVHVSRFSCIFRLIIGLLGLIDRLNWSIRILNIIFSELIALSPIYLPLRFSNYPIDDPTPSVCCRGCSAGFFLLSKKQFTLFRISKKQKTRPKTPHAFLGNL